MGQGSGVVVRRPTPLSIADFEGVEVEALSPAKQEVSVLGPGYGFGLGLGDLGPEFRWLWARVQVFW
jgi:hypothetical protein